MDKNRAFDNKGYTQSNHDIRDSPPADYDDGNEAPIDYEFENGPPVDYADESSLSADYDDMVASTADHDDGDEPQPSPTTNNSVLDQRSEEPLISVPSEHSVVDMTRSSSPEVVTEMGSNIEERDEVIEMKTMSSYAGAGFDDQGNASLAASGRDDGSDEQEALQMKDESRDAVNKPGPLRVRRRWTRNKEDYVHTVEEFNKFIDKNKRDYFADQEKKSSSYKKRNEQKLKRYISRLRYFFHTFSLWRGSIKEIEGSFGISVVSYFRFLRWLLFVNLFTTVLLLGCVVLPQILVRPSLFVETVTCPADANQSQAIQTTNANDNLYVSAACICSGNYRASIQSINSLPWYNAILNIIQGTEWMQTTVLFLGYYFIKPSYDLGAAILLTLLGVFIVTLLLIVHGTSANIRQELVLTSNHRKFRYCEMIFSAWDYSLTSPTACSRKHNQIYQQIQFNLKKDSEDRDRHEMPLLRKSGIYIMRALVSIVIISLLAAFAALLYFLMVKWIPVLKEKNLSWILELLVQYLPSITLAVVNFLLSIVFGQVLKLAYLNSDQYMKSYMAVTVFTRLSSVSLLILTAYAGINDKNCSKSCGTCFRYQCWETYLGQQLYALAILDFLLTLALTILEFVKKFFVSRCCKGSSVIQNFGTQEFDIAENVLDLVYTQTICWIGILFSPLLAAATVIKLFLFFYFKKVSLFHNFVPSQKPQSTSKSNFFFLVVLMVALTLSYGIVCYAIGWIPTSQSCGPYRLHTSDRYLMYSGIADSVAAWPTNLRGLAYFVFSWAFVLVVVFFSVLFICYYRALASRTERLEALLENQILLRSKDRQYLLAHVRELYMRGYYTGNSKSD